MTWEKEFNIELKNQNIMLCIWQDPNFRIMAFNVHIKRLKRE